jgi:hypothetical protein
MTSSSPDIVALEDAFSIRDGNEGPSWKHPHAFHRNLPPHHHDDQDGIPFITKYAYKKSRYVLRLVESLQITESMLVDDNEDHQDDEVDEDVPMEEEDDGEAEEDEGSQGGPSAPTETLSVLMRTCARISSQLSSLESLKHSGLSRLELSRMILHLLKLASATYTLHDEGTNSAAGERKVSLHYENVGYICTATTTEDEAAHENTPDPKALEADLAGRRFALPSPAREVLLSMVVNLLSNKGPLRSVSNAAIFPDTGNKEDEESRFLLIIHWKALLRMLLRTAPYLDEHKVGTAPMVSNSRHSTIVKRTVQLIRDARHFFDQGLRPNDASAIDDRTARSIWEMVKSDVMFHAHTHACYRALIMLYLFQPSRCSSQYYLERLPLWFEAWTNIDRCPEMDFLWLALFCRARKHLPVGYDWGPIRRRLLTHAQYWLQLPIGGVSMDKSFPNASTPRSRTCPSRLKVFAGASSSYEEGIDFVAKVAKLLVIGLGTGEKEENAMSEGTLDVLRFLDFVTPYFNPSNLGSWTFTLGAFLHYFCYELCCRMGAAGSIETLRSTRPALVEALCGVEPTLSVASLPPKEVVALMDALLPLCQQSLYSKNGHVGRAGEAAMLYLAQIDPARVTPAFIDFATRALDISAVNLAHQAPAALSALTRLLQPALRSSPNILLVRLPEILRLTLAGIDSNDQNKTIRTLILYRSLTSWIPVGGTPEKWKALQLPAPTSQSPSADEADDTNRLGSDLLGELYKPTQHPDYLKALEALPDSSLLKQGSDVSDLDFRLLVDEAAFALSDWVLEFLDRVYALLRATGEREKAGKTASGVANRHSSADVQQARNFSRVLKECLIQTFAAMDPEIHKSAVQSVARFLEEETLPSAAKDTSLLCQATCSARVNPQTGEVSSPGLDALVPVLLDDLEHHSNKTITYRLRCLAGAVRACGLGIKKHKKEITRAIEFALLSKDKHVHKTGCKLLRHTLSTCCESYTLACDTIPRLVKKENDDKVMLGRSAQLHDDPVQWHVPDGECVQLAWSLLKQHVLVRISKLPGSEGAAMDVDSTNLTYQLDFQEIRRCLRVIRYALRGGAGILLDVDTGEDFVDKDGEPVQMEGDIPVPEELSDLTLFPYEQAMHRLLKSAPEETYRSIIQTRGRLCTFVINMTSLMASETFKLEEQLPEESDLGSSSGGDAPVTDRKYKGLLSTDSKICKETSDIALLLLTRRGASFRSQEGKTIWKAQKQLATDFALLSQADHITESLQRAQLYGSCGTVWFKDGEDAGKTLPRRLLVARIQLFHDSLQRTASFEVPRRLRRLFRAEKVSRKILFSTTTNINDLNTSMVQILESAPTSALSSYEGMVDGLFSLCCHSNTQVRASAIGVVDYAITRFGWLLRPRVPRLLAAVNLQDDAMHGKFGVPSCSALKTQVDGQGKRKRLAEAMKGVCSILATPRAGKLMMGSEKMRCEFVTTICGTEALVSIMPAEEMQKMVHYLHSLFSPFRLKFYRLPRATQHDRQVHQKCLNFLLDTLANEKDSEKEEGDAKSAHWRKLLHACWFLTVQVDTEDMQEKDALIPAKLWKTCFQIIEQEYGQPLQRVAVGLLGRLIMLTKDEPGRQMLRDQMVTKSFCKFFGNALVYDHKEDSSVGGGHDAQWATGVADMIRDSARNIAPRSLFPFQRTNQSSGTFKVSHAQMVEQILLGLNQEDATVAARYLLSFSREMAASPPSEDQRNQQCTSAEIFAGITRAFLQMLDDEDLDSMWKTDLLPFLDDVVSKIPISLSGAYFDCVRFSIQFSPPPRFFPMTSWIFDKIEGSLWDPTKAKGSTSEEEETEQPGKNGTKQGTDGFTAQSKWLYLCCALLVELDETEVEGSMRRIPWYTSALSNTTETTEAVTQAETDMQESWKLISEKLLPRLTGALGHPYESCRDHIAGCLFRICYCHRKMARSSASGGPSRTNSSISLASLGGEDDPGTYIVQKLLALQRSAEESYQIRYNSLITARRFFSYCIHFGEAKHEFVDYIIPLLPLAFEALNSNVEDAGEASEADTVAKRALEAEVVKGYRYTIAELSVSPVMSYGGNRDISRVLSAAADASKHETWQVRHASANFLRCFQGSHKFLFTDESAEQITSIAAGLLSDERREVSAAAMAAVTGIIAALPSEAVAKLVQKYATQAKKSTMKRKKKGGKASEATTDAPDEEQIKKEQKRAKTQQSSVFFLCATILSQPYDTPPYVPKALAAISKHSFERNAPLGVRDIVKKCCAEYKRTHMSDNWELHRKMFTQEEIEALEDVVSSPHYYA